MGGLSSPFHLHNYGTDFQWLLDAGVLPVLCGLRKQSLSFPVEKFFKARLYKLH